MQLSAGLRQARTALSCIPRQCKSTTSPARPLRALSSSPIRPTLAHPRLYRQSSALLRCSIWKGVNKRYHADTQDSNSPALRPIGGDNEAVSGNVRQQLIADFRARVDELESAPAPHPLGWLLPSFSEADPTRCIALVVPDNDTRDAAREALRKECKRWHGLVGILRSSYVSVVVLRSTLDALREDLQHDSELGFKGEMRVYCAVASRHEMDPILASPEMKTYIEASKHGENEKHRLLLHSKGALHKSIEVDKPTVEVQTDSTETTAASSNINYLDSYRKSLAWFLKRFACCAIVTIGGTACLTYFATKATCECNELWSGTEYEQEQHHGESYNKGKSKIKSALGVQHGAIQTTGDVDASTHIHHGCDANPLSSSSPTIGNNQPNGNEGLTQEQ